MWANVVLPVGIPILTGLTYLGYRHPITFRIVWQVSTVVSAAAAIFLLGWWYGGDATLKAATPFISAYRKAADATNASDLIVKSAVLWLVLANFYLTLLQIILYSVHKEKKVDVG